MAAFTADRKNTDLNQDRGAVGYTSNALKLFVEHLEERPGNKLLDVGPVCQENIGFFASRVNKLYVCDMFIRLDRCIRKGQPRGPNLGQPRLPPSKVSMEFCCGSWPTVWTIPDVKRLVTLCHALLRPGGMAMVVVLGDQYGSSETNAFVVGEKFSNSTAASTASSPAFTQSPKPGCVVHDGAFYPGQVVHMPGGFYGISFQKRIIRTEAGGAHPVNTYA